MFDQELYERDAAELETHEGDLFHNYEIKNWELSKRLYQILALSAVLNIAALGFIGESNLLTRRGCDSPFVGRVCEVLDMAYVGSMVLGTEREYVDEAYDKINLSDADITFISRDGDNAPLTYPAGYFQIANPEQFNGTQNVTDPMAGFNAGPVAGIPYTPNPSDSMLNTLPHLPQPNPNPVIGGTPDSPFGISGENPTTGGVRKGRRGGRISNGDANANAAEPDDTKIADAGVQPSPTPLSTEAVTTLDVNKKPLTDFADDVATQWAENKIDLNQQFTVTLDGVLTNDGKLDPQKSKFDPTKEKGDEKMINVAKEALEAVGQSGFLTYLKSLGVDKVNIVVIQDDKQISAIITSSQRSPERARTISSGLTNYISIGKMAAKDPSDELTLLNGVTVTADGSNFVLSFAVPKPIAQEMINRKLKEAQAKKAQQSQPNGNAIAKPNDNTAKR
jgi:hypothetical protein